MAQVDAVPKMFLVAQCAACHHGGSVETHEQQVFAWIEVATRCWSDRAGPFCLHSICKGMLHEIASDQTGG